MVRIGVVAVVGAACVGAGVISGAGPNGQPRAPGTGAGGAGESVKLPPVPLEPEAVWKPAVAAYRTKRAAERVTVTLRTEKQSKTSDFVVRFDPGKAEDHADRAVLLELGTLRAHASGGTVVVWSAQHEGTYFQGEYTGEFTAERLEAILPPVPAPQLACAADVRADRPVYLAVYLPAVRWSDGALPMDDESAPITMPGVSSNGTVSWVQDRKTGRLLKLTATLKEPAVRLELACAAVEPGDPGTWKPDLSKRKRVGSVAELTKKVEAPKGEPGKTEPVKPEADKPAAPAAAPGSQDAPAVKP